MLTSPFRSPHDARRPSHSVSASPYVAVSTRVGLERSMARLPVSLRADLARTPTEMNATKGAWSESLARKLLGQRWGDSVMTVDPMRRGGRGFDLLALRIDSRGRVREVIVGEVKFGSSRLSMTSDGRQLGLAWTRRRLLENAEHYARHEGSAPAGAPVLHARASEALRDAAEGKVGLSREEIRVEITGTAFRVEVRQSGGSLRTLLHARYDKLPRYVQRAIRSNFESSFRAAGSSPDEARQLAAEACRNPQFFRWMASFPQYSWRAGVDRTTATTAIAAGTVAALTRAAMDAWRHGRVDWQIVARAAALGTVAGGAGAYAGVQAAAAMTATAAGRDLARALHLGHSAARVGVATVGKAVGGIVSAAVFSYGAVALGMSDLRTANRSMFAAGLGIGASVAAPGATLTVAMAVGTASTGTAISTLTGAAATNAALAWLGFGTIAAGGWGMAGGVLVLSGIGIVAGIAIPLLVSPLWAWLDDRERRRMVSGRIEIAKGCLQAFG